MNVREVLARAEELEQLRAVYSLMSSWLTDTDEIFFGDGDKLVSEEIRQQVIDSLGEQIDAVSSDLEDLMEKEITGEKDD